MSISTRDAFLKDIAESSHEISVRAFNICETLDLVTVRDLHDYIMKHKDFRNVRNCGSKTNKELLELHKLFYTDAFAEEAPEKPIDKQSVISKQSFEFLVSGEFDRLSVRAQNALMNFMDQQLPTKEFVKENFIDRTFSPSKLRNVGRKTVIELDEFIKKLISIYYKADNDEISSLEIARIELQDLLGFNVSEEFYLDKYASKQFPLLAFSAKYFNEILDLESLEGYVLQNHFQMLENVFTLEELGNKFKLTRERVRQKREKAHLKARSVFSRLSVLIPRTDYESSIIEKKFISLPDGIENEQFKEEIENVGIIFSAFILGVLFGKTHYSISPNDKIERPEKIQFYETYKSFKKISGSYLISSEVVKKHDLLNFMSTVLAQLSARSEEDQTYEIELLKSTNYIGELEFILSRIMEEEFELNVVGGRYIIKRNAAKRVFEYAHEALEKIGKPAHVTEIIATILKDYPDFESSETSIKAAMGHNKDLFIYFGRSSTFGLKIWEDQYQNIKGGTIRDIVEEFLEQYNEPCHASAIAEYVNKYRKTEEHSIINNLKMSGDKRFVFLKDGYIGLTSKNYEKNSSKFKLQNISLDDLMNNIFSE